MKLFYCNKYIWDIKRLLILTMAEKRNYAEFTFRSYSQNEQQRCSDC
jgi:hypothetical protein